jgi:DNA polymerase III epsilon subunit-like protein
MDFIFIDTETTHLETGKGEIIEFALILDTKHVRNKKTVCYKIQPKNIATADPRALEINGYTEESWRAAKTMDTAVHDMYFRLCGRDKILIGHNIKFDLEHLNHLFVSRGYRTVGVYTIDTKSLALEHLPFLKSYSLESIRDFFGISKEGSHRALKDVVDCRTIYYKLVRASTLQRLYWRSRWTVKRWIKRYFQSG